jgi:hypothetical protein
VLLFWAIWQMNSLVRDANIKFLITLIGFTSGLVVAIAPSALTQATENFLSYSASLGLPVNYNGPACIQLG